MSKVKVRYYGLGGAGTNLVSMINHPDVETCYVDTSRSNLGDNINPNSVYLVEGLDGSGKHRRENYAVLAKHVDSVLEEFPPATFNVLVFSAGGGSGSTLSPLLLRRMLELKETVVCVMVGADDSAITINNTINTIKSLESISAMTQMPVVVSYHENTPGVSRGAIDDEVLFVLEALQELSAQDKRELDTQDVTNWLHYQKVTPVTPQLSFLSICDSRKSASEVVEPISIVSIYIDASHDNPFGTPHYATVGFSQQPMELAEQLHYVINTTDVEENYNRLITRQTELNRTYSGYRQRKNVLDVDDDLTSDGLVF